MRSSARSGRSGPASGRERATRRDLDHAARFDFYLPEFVQLVLSAIADARDPPLERRRLAAGGRLYGGPWSRMFDYGRTFGGKVKRADCDSEIGGLRGHSPDRRHAMTASGSGSGLKMHLPAFDRTVRTVWSVATPSAFNNFAAVSPGVERILTADVDERILQRSTASGTIPRDFKDTIMIRQFEYTAYASSPGCGRDRRSWGTAATSSGSRAAGT